MPGAFGRLGGTEGGWVDVLRLWQDREAVVLGWNSPWERINRIYFSFHSTHKEPSGEGRGSRNNPNEKVSFPILIGALDVCALSHAWLSTSFDAYSGVRRYRSGSVWGDVEDRLQRAGGHGVSGESFDERRAVWLMRSGHVPFSHVHSEEAELNDGDVVGSRQNFGSHVSSLNIRKRMIEEMSVVRGGTGRLVFNQLERVRLKGIESLSLSLPYRVGLLVTSLGRNVQQWVTREGQKEVEVELLEYLDEIKVSSLSPQKGIPTRATGAATTVVSLSFLPLEAPVLSAAELGGGGYGHSRVWGRSPNNLLSVWQPRHPLDGRSVVSLRHSNELNLLSGRRQKEWASEADSLPYPSLSSLTSLLSSVLPSALKDKKQLSVSKLVDLSVLSEETQGEGQRDDLPLKRTNGTQKGALSETVTVTVKPTAKETGGKKSERVHQRKEEEEVEGGESTKGTPADWIKRGGGSHHQVGNSTQGGLSVSGCVRQMGSANCTQNETATNCSTRLPLPGTVPVSAEAPKSSTSAKKKVMKEEKRNDTNTNSTTQSSDPVPPTSTAFSLCLSAQTSVDELNGAVGWALMGGRPLVPSVHLRVDAEIVSIALPSPSSSEDRLEGLQRVLSLSFPLFSLRLSALPPTRQRISESIQRTSRKKKSSQTKHKKGRISKDKWRRPARGRHSETETGAVVVSVTAGRGKGGEGKKATGLTSPFEVCLWLDRWTSREAFEELLRREKEKERSGAAGDTSRALVVLVP
uniref:Uncharacterized protein n=1 Tax=Chromera velia CCMP2878 TaxID=1169474 RepID=A0A0G4FGL4_9ALVE|eukprot:Cvel_16817.t1-p1 / transcript=Cvel_16817.t1 / gene=Cvel_16817 / organism=Chromera_velia_CCMP2878 / gene_product=hypothetical protein / transcript_product=hypothetical protein / location=Cvel_scaffold1313:24711-28256(-) / protein_length=747 / sequence_SO=supercontig / SO=protein_coding / is_pseudo=false